MADNFSGVQFKYTFRDYQQQFLANISEHLSDDKIHVVAAPGAGKTILALEMCRLIGEKALVIVPSVALKEQWIERLTKDFTGTNDPGFVSSTLVGVPENAGNRLPVVTVITYQMLHSMVRRGDNVAAAIISQGIRTIVLDECHHMRRTWFVSLKNVVSALKDCKLISLTATPPYDNGPEFRNYMDLCGEIDDRITAGQLVKSGCLCPHQDFIYFNLPSREQDELAENVSQFANDLTAELKSNEQFVSAVALNDFISFPMNHIDEIMKDLDFYVAMCAFLASVGCNYNASGLGIEFAVPSLTKDHLALILERYLYGKIPEARIISELLGNVRTRLEIAGCLKDKHVDLHYSAELSRRILANSGKLDSICEIVDHEYANLGDRLNMAICTDYIKDEYYSVQDEDEIAEIGVMSIFRKLRGRCPHINVAVLTGSVIFIPTLYADELREIAAAEYRITDDELKIRELGIDFDYSSVEFSENRRKYAVNILTKLFRTRDIQVLIGTIALIGEGWDAPFVNSLIIASSVSTYVTSNQVRGRAIRIDRADPGKASNIWHLVTMESCGDRYIRGRDYSAISERFIGFEGVDPAHDVIETGIERLNVKYEPYSREEVLAANKKTFELAADRENTRASWERALANYTPEFYERISDRTVTRNYAAKIGFVRKWKVTRQTRRLIQALQRSHLLPLNVKLHVEYNERTGFKISLVPDKKASQASGGYIGTHEQMMFASAVRQQYEFSAKSRYVVSFAGRIYPIPEILGRRKDTAEIYRNALGLPFSELINIRSDEGKLAVLQSRLKHLQ